MIDTEKKPLLNQTAIVTGAGRGLGTAVAKALAAAGANVIVNDINPDRAEQVQDAIRQAGGQALAIAADVSNKFHGVNLIENARAAFGRLDILVNNAHIQPKGTLLKMDEWDWNRTFEVNVKGVFFMTQLCSRVMADENQPDGGVVINLGVALPPECPVNIAYAASQSALTGFTQAAAQELAVSHIRVNGVLLPPMANDDEKRPLLTQQALATILDLCQNRQITGALIKLQNKD
ncbi:MAG: hypothetical protein Kow0080_13060 [Candidatus Promineifilaceae bacterium]